MHALTQQQPWQANIRLRFARRGVETVLAERCHFGPLRVQRPFYPESRQICHVYLLHPPGGLVSGDHLQVEMQLDKGARTLLTTPGAGKFYRSDGQRSVQQHQHLNIASGACLEWLPQENIFFDGVRADTLTRVDLHGDANFIGWDIACLGRPASSEILRRCSLRQRFEVWRDHQPLWLERSTYSENCAVFEAGWGLRGHGVVGSLVCTSSDTQLVQQVREAVKVEEGALFGVTQLDEVLVCRYLG
ncbi:Urease accessory protein UreD, partial [hydrothermal vent metagenome]